jgi:metal-responsive CopG/Arc/MetJ family transcriptional regulator
MKTYTSTGLSLPTELVRKIDNERGDISRSRYILRLLEKLYIGYGQQLVKDKTKQDSPDRRFETLQSSESRRP